MSLLYFQQYGDIAALRGPDERDIYMILIRFSISFLLRFCTVYIEVLYIHLSFFRTIRFHPFIQTQNNTYIEC